LINVRAFVDAQAASVSGTFYGSANNPRIVRIKRHAVEALRCVLFMMRTGRPGIVGWNSARSWANTRQHRQHVAWARQARRQR